MNKRTLILLGAGVLVGAAGIGVAVVAQEEVRPPSFPGEIVVDAQQPVARPDDSKQVVVVNLDLTFEKGELVGAELASSEQINSIAPKVFLRQGGDWLVRLDSDPSRFFFVSNPGWREVQGASESAAGTWFGQTGTIEWPLVIPLYSGGEKFDVSGFTILDARTGEELGSFQL